MTIRHTSLDSVNIPNWKWHKFLEITIDSISKFEPKPYLIADNFLQNEVEYGSKKNPFKVMTMTWACKTNKLRQIRAACVHSANNTSVLNLVFKPWYNFELPFFGADFVTLPSGHLLALDLQPVLKNDLSHTELVWKRLLPIFEHWDSLLPNGGPIPTEAEPFFSPGFLWTRLPLSTQSDEIINQIIEPAFKEYISLYLDLVKKAKPVSNDRSNLLKDGQKRYLKFRAEKDPARKMLTSFYGKDWTESYIHEVLFNFDIEK